MPPFRRRPPLKPRWDRIGAGLFCFAVWGLVIFAIQRCAS